ncbi:hypothetical protein CAP36_15395 [Chitinophagaceae bacterium IBVUCB2]|nr:hypothetical protein CAP36_15395 [Chitinophagaceae bacterium IBVUCB2]
MNNSDHQKTLSQLDRFKKKQKLTVQEKMDIFTSVYNLQGDEKPSDLREIIDVVLDKYGECFTMSEEYDKQTFLNIYGEPKENYLLLNKIEDILDIVLGELSIRNDITTIFPATTANKNSLTPYTKDNSIEFLAMKKLNIYSSTSFALDRLITNQRHIDFPMTEDIFENLTWIDDFEKPSKIVFALIKRAFNNSRQNYTRVFIQWFNSHFWKEEFGQIEFENDKTLFNSVFLPFMEHAEVRLTINANHLEKKSQHISILGGQELSEIGQQYLKSLPPFDNIDDKLLLFE